MTAYRRRYPRDLKTNRAYGAAALVRVLYPDYERNSGAAPECMSEEMCPRGAPRGAPRSTFTLFIYLFPRVRGKFL